MDKIFTQEELKKSLPTKYSVSVVRFLEIGEILGIFKKTSVYGQWEFVQSGNLIENKTDSSNESRITQILSIMDDQILSIMDDQIIPSEQPLVEPIKPIELPTENINVSEEVTRKDAYIEIPLEDKPEIKPDNRNNHGPRPTQLYNGRSTDGTWLSGLKGTSWWNGR